MTELNKSQKLGLARTYLTSLGFDHEAVEEAMAALKPFVSRQDAIEQGGGLIARLTSTGKADGRLFDAAPFFRIANEEALTSAIESGFQWHSTRLLDGYLEGEEPPIRDLFDIVNQENPGFDLMRYGRDVVSVVEIDDRAAQVWMANHRPDLLQRIADSSDGPEGEWSAEALDRFAPALP